MNHIHPPFHKRFSGNIHKRKDNTMICLYKHGREKHNVQLESNKGNRLLFSISFHFITPGWQQQSCSSIHYVLLLYGGKFSNKLEPAVSRYVE